MQCDAEKTKYHLSCQPRTWEVTGGQLNTWYFAEYTGHNSGAKG